MKTAATTLIAVGTFARGAMALIAARDETRTCPGGLRELRTVNLPYLQFNTTATEEELKKDDDHGHAQPWMPHREGDKYTLKFRVVEVAPRTKPSLGFGPKLVAGYRYLLFDEDRKYGLVGQGCVVEGKVICKHPDANANATAANATSGAPSAACGTPCVQDVHRPQLEYVKGVLGATGTALASTMGSQYHPKAAAMIGLGAGTMTEWLLDAFGEMTVDAVDVEASVVKAGFECFGLGQGASGARLTTHVEDGMAFLRKQQKDHYDVVLLDVTPVPKHFLSSIELIDEKLAPGGILALNGWKYDQHWKDMVQGLASKFPAVYITHVGSGNVLLFTAKSKAESGGTPFPEHFPADLAGLSSESAKWFKQFKWGLVNAKN